VNDRTAGKQQQLHLFGRDKSCRQLYDSYEKIYRHGQGTLLVRGPAGIGKTALVKQLLRDKAGASLFVVTGKCAQLEHTPYISLRHAFGNLLKQILTESPREIKLWKQRMNQKLMPYAAILTTLIPEMKWFIQSQTKTVHLPPAEQQVRFQHAVRELIDVFATANKGLLLFLDDLQWIDKATKDLLGYLLETKANPYLTVIGAYRDDEVPADHPLTHLLEELGQNNIDVHMVSLEPLALAHVTDWMNDMFVMREDEIYYLSKTIYRITQGNPLFISQLLESFSEEAIIHLHADTNKWIMDKNKLKQSSLNDSVLDVVIRRFSAMPASTKQLLQTAACLGNLFEADILKEVSDASGTDLSAVLKPAIDKGLILEWADEYDAQAAGKEEGKTYRFLHDRIQQAVYLTLSEEEQKDQHLRIGQGLLKRCKQEITEQHIFAVVHHLNHCHDQLTETEKKELAAWNTSAGEKAKASAAFAEALFFYRTGRQLLTDAMWQSDYALAYDLMLGLGEAEYLNMYFAKAEEVFDVIMTHAASAIDIGKVYKLKIVFYTHINETEKAVSAGVKGMALFGLHVRTAPGKLALAKAYTMSRLAARRNKRKHLPHLSEEAYKMMMEILALTVIPAYLEDQKLTALLIFKGMNLIRENTVPEVSATVYINYALILSAGRNDYENSYKYARLAMEQAEKQSGDRQLASLYFTYASFIHHWKHPLKENLNYLYRSQQLCIETGDIHLAGANSAFIGVILLMKGMPLLSMKHKIEEQLVFAEENKYAIATDYLRETSNWIDKLSFSSEQTGAAHDSEFTGNTSVKMMHDILRLQMSYLLKDETEASGIMGNLEAVVADTFNMITAPDYYFYHGLWTAAFIRQRKGNRRKSQKKLKYSISKLKTFAEQAPVNFRQKYLLVSAEWEAIRGRKLDAIELYEQAFQTAKENGFLQDAAIICECAAQFHAAAGLDHAANAYAREAHDYYKAWGADRLADRLHSLYPEALQHLVSPVAAANADVDEDMKTEVLSASTAVLSKEKSADKQIALLMKNIRLHTSAMRAFLILNDHGTYHIAASDFSEKEGICPKQNEDRQHNYSAAIVNTAAETLQLIVLEDAHNDGDFIHDADVKRRQVRSVLCLPVMKQAKLLGILYLENNQRAGVFYTNQEGLLTIVTSLAAMLFESNFFYERLEEKIEERTLLLNQTNEELTKTNQLLADSQEARQVLLAKVVHDIRSPFAAVQGYAELILDGTVEDSEQQHAYLKAMKSRLVYIGKLMEDMVELGRLELDSLSFTMDYLPADQLFTHLCSRFDTEMEKEGVRYSWQLPDPAPAMYPLIEADVQRLEQVMTNLVTNAVTHGGKKEICISLSLNGEQAMIVVEDHGAGIAEEDIPYVFDRYYTKSTSGHGLGLVICKEIIKKHRGKLWLKSKLGKGTEFFVSLPVYKEE
jgi:predicted ATPase